jgi:hypothetical protein
MFVKTFPPHILSFLTHTHKKSTVGEDKPGELVENSDISEEVKEKILEKNALEFLGIKKEKFLS